MRNAAAHFDDDLAFETPARKSKASRKPRGDGARKRPAAKSKKNRTRYLHYVAVGLSATLAIGIVVNALALQHSRHPAPLFGQAIQLGDEPASAPAAALAPPVLAPAPRKPIEQAAVVPPPLQPIAPAKLVTHELPAPVQRPHHAAAEPSAPAAHAKSEDSIGKLLKNASTTASSPAKGAVSDKAKDEKPKDAARTDKTKEKDDPKTVMAAQHALMKLGFVIKPNGTNGPTTHSAIEAFQREQHLPVNGELSHKLLKQLSAESGVAID